MPCIAKAVSDQERRTLAGFSRFLTSLGGAAIVVAGCTDLNGQVVEKTREVTDQPTISLMDGKIRGGQNCGPTCQAQAGGGVIGHVDAATARPDGRAVVTGWACLHGVEVSIDIHLYIGGPAGTGQLLTAGTASRQAEPAVGAACGTSDTAHRFRLVLPAAAIETHPQAPVYVHGIRPTPLPYQPYWGNALLLRSGEVRLPSPVMAVAQHPAGWDVGLTKRRAATLFPNDSSLYFESCPDTPTGSCLNDLPRLGEFYNLEHDQIFLSKPNCRINSAAHFSPGPRAGENQDVPCPFFFHWAEAPTDQAVVGRVTVDTLGFTHSMTVNNYLGLQEITAQAPNYAGVAEEVLPDIRDVMRIRFDLRAQICSGGQPNDAYRHGRFMVYERFNEEESHATLMAMNLMTFAYHPVDGPAPEFLMTPFMEEGAFCRAHGGEACILETQWIGTMNGASWGFIPEGAPLVPHVDSTPDCQGELADLPWITYDIPVQEVIARLVAQGLLDPGTVRGPAQAWIVNGVETWGRTKAQADVARRYTFIAQDPPAAVPAGQFRVLEDNLTGIYYYDGNDWLCQYVNHFHAGHATVDEIDTIHKRKPHAGTFTICPGWELYLDEIDHRPL